MRLCFLFGFQSPVRECDEESYFANSDVLGSIGKLKMNNDKGK